MPTVSVLLPCYNAETTLVETLESLFNQTLTDYEVIAVEDGSLDATADLLHMWAAKEPRLKVLQKKHGGIISALNHGLATCQADLVARIDADDRAHPERLARQVTYLIEHPEIAVVSCLVEGFPPGLVREGFRIYLEWLNSLISPEEIEREIFVESPLAHPSVMFRKTAVEAVGGYQEYGWPEDYDLWLRLYLSGARFAKVPEVLLAWREHPQRLTRCDTRYSLENFLRAKAHYLMRGPLSGCDGVIIWGAGMMGRRLSKQLDRLNAPLAAFIDIDPRKIGNTRRGKPILPPDQLMEWRSRYRHPVVLAAVGARGARRLIREQLKKMGLSEGLDWWSAA